MKWSPRMNHKERKRKTKYQVKHADAATWGKGPTGPGRRRLLRAPRSGLFSRSVPRERPSGPSAGWSCPRLGGCEGHAGLGPPQQSVGETRGEPRLPGGIPGPWLSNTAATGWRSCACGQAGQASWHEEEAGLLASCPRAVCGSE